MRFTIEGRGELSADNMRVHELCEAEKALGVNMTEGTGAAIAIQLFVAMRREDKVKPAHALADDVMRADVTSFAEVEEDEEEGPPDEAADDEEAAESETTESPEGRGSLLISGVPR